MGKNILTYEEFFNDYDLVSENISSLDFIQMLIEE